MPQDDTLCPDGLNEVIRLEIKAWASVDQVGHHLCHGPLLVSVKDVLVRLEIAVQQLQCSNIDIVFMLSSQTNAQTVSFNKEGMVGLVMFKITCKWNVSTVTSFCGLHIGILDWNLVITTKISFFIFETKTKYTKSATGPWMKPNIDFIPFSKRREE